MAKRVAICLRVRRYSSLSTRTLRASAGVSGVGLSSGLLISFSHGPRLGCPAGGHELLGVLLVAWEIHGFPRFPGSLAALFRGRGCGLLGCLRHGVSLSFTFIWIAAIQMFARLDCARGELQEYAILPFCCQAILRSFRHVCNAAFHSSLLVRLHKNRAIK